MLARPTITETRLHVCRALAPRGAVALGFRRSAAWKAVALGGLLASIIGCGARIPEFQPNRVYQATLERETGESLEDARGDVQAILTEWFGTPEDPKWPSGEAFGDVDSVAQLVSLEDLKRASGRVYSDQDDKHFGLFREHCTTCHGVTGDGKGPASMLQHPYPRDFRAGVFKYKSTPRGEKPTRDDLLKTLRRGLPGVAMPAFAILPEEDLNAVVDYVIYLSVRGEMERRLLSIAARDLDYSSEALGDRWLLESEGADQAAVVEEQRQWIVEEYLDVATSWSEASAHVSDPPEPAFPLDDSAAIAAGRELFHGPIANCATCHGVNGAGLDPVLPDYDDWTKEWTSKLGIDPADRDRLEDFFAAGAYRPRALAPRNLTHGVYRGGSQPNDIYLRLIHGIDGTPMPAVNLVEQPSAAGLTATQVWQLVAYVRSLGLPASSENQAQDQGSSDGDGEVVAQEGRVVPGDQSPRTRLLASEAGGGA